MKKVILILTVFCSFLAQAQTTGAITEKELLGEWSLRKISLLGNIADLKTGEIEVSDEFARQKGQTKEALAEQFKKKLPDMHGTLVFVSDMRMQYTIGTSQTALGSYIITQEDNKQYIADEYSGSKIEIYFKEGLLYWNVLTNDGMVTMAWQKEAP